MKKLIFALFLVGCQQQQETAYKSGDIVKLKSGGPKMTVVYDVYKGNSVKVEWLDNLGQPQHNLYEQTQLERE